MITKSKKESTKRCLNLNRTFLLKTFQIYFLFIFFFIIKTLSGNECETNSPLKIGLIDNYYINYEYYLYYELGNFAVNNNLRIKPLISYQDIRKTSSEGYYFKGYITRLDIRYQFTNTLDVRLISEYNDFSEQYFFQPLVSWRPNPDTIFYVGGNQNLINDFTDYNSPHYRVNRSQFFLKLQYLI